MALILAGLKLSMVYAVVGVVAMEFIAAQVGLGARIQYYYEAFDVGFHVRVYHPHDAAVRRLCRSGAGARGVDDARAQMICN